MKNTVDSSLLQFSTEELLCKRYYEQYPETRLMKKEEFGQFLRETIKKNENNKNGTTTVLTADSLIPDGYNVMALKHLRYLPGCFHSHDFFEINCVLSGSCTYQTADKTMRIQAGDIVVFPPHNDHSIDVCSDDCILINILIRSNTFDLYFFSIFEHYDLLLEFWTQALYGKREIAYLLFHCGDDTNIRNCVLNVYRESTRKHKYQGQMLDALIHVFMITLLQYHEQDVIVANPESQEDDQNFIRVINYIARSYKTLTLTDLANQFHYSERQMMRILKEYTGLGFGDLIRDVRLKKAVALLEKSSVSIQSIVEAVGYSDLSHFYRVFKKEYGCTPVEYRANKSL